MSHPVHGREVRGYSLRPSQNRSGGTIERSFGVAEPGDLAAWLWALRPWRKVCLEIVKRPRGTKGFQVLPWRWIVERTFGWLGRYCRLSKDYEYLPHTSETMIRVAMIHLMVRRLARMVPS
jgi:hypothetical protein